MPDRPIIFSAPMVRALLAGRKTQTRRLLPQAHPRFPDHNQIRTDVLAYDPARPEVWYWDGKHDRVGASYPLRFAVGDRLYVREAWRSDRGLDRHNAAEIEEACLGAGYSRVWAPVFYEVDAARVNFENGMVAGRYRHARFMPRWASRLTLTVTDVRVQRLQDISEADAMAEGIADDLPVDQPPAMRFASLWNSLHGPDAWDANPWCVAVSFTVEQRNIDAPEGLGG